MKWNKTKIVVVEMLTALFVLGFTAVIFSLWHSQWVASLAPFAGIIILWLPSRLVNKSLTLNEMLSQAMLIVLIGVVTMFVLLSIAYFSAGSQKTAKAIVTIIATMLMLTVNFIISREIANRDYRQYSQPLIFFGFTGLTAIIWLGCWYLITRQVALW